MLSRMGFTILSLNGVQNIVKCLCDMDIKNEFDLCKHISGVASKQEL